MRTEHPLYSQQCLSTAVILCAPASNIQCRGSRCQFLVGHAFHGSYDSMTSSLTFIVIQFQSFSYTFAGLVSQRPDPLTYKAFASSALDYLPIYPPPCLRARFFKTSTRSVLILKPSHTIRRILPKTPRLMLIMSHTRRSPYLSRQKTRG